MGATAAAASGSPSPPLEYERDSPVDVSSTSEAGSASGGAGSSAVTPPPRNPQLMERWSSEEMRHIQCHLETKELWDKFNDLGTEMIITKTGRLVPYFNILMRLSKLVAIMEHNGKHKTPAVPVGSCKKMNSII